QTLKDAVNEALRDWAANFATSHYCLGSALGPHPYPQMVGYFQEVIGRETKMQCLDRFGTPDCVIACVGGGSNAIGIFAPFLANEKITLIGVEAGGRGPETGDHAARFLSGRPGVLHGCYSYLLQDDEGQVLETHSISAGLDYPMVGPQHAQLYATERVTYANVQDDAVIAAFKLLAKTEGIIPALESAHALAYVCAHAKQWPKNFNVVINLSGRGDKDLPQLFEKNLL
ncbi:MAG TPA: pyridoxal-phosphate dependent enzyme, partial [Gammaproteobacteria bacterium]|nr:pyridoxal-phosphate dependent enzyme [Gammaproteobacteria bacterium]